MIISAFINFASYSVNLLLALFPSSNGFPIEVSNSISIISGYIGILSPIVPIDTMATIISLIISFELAVFSFKGLKWIFSFIPLIGGRG